MSTSSQMGTAPFSDDDMGLFHRLQELQPQIHRLMQISGAAGLSIGVLHQNKIIHTSHLGRKDVSSGQVADDDTLYWVGSIAKSMTAAAIGVLAQEKKVDWDDTVSSVLPEFKHQNSDIREKATIHDLLCHKSGLGGKAGLWQRDHARIVISREDFVNTTTYLPACYPLGEVWMPSNWNYGLVDEVIERASGQSYGTFLEERLFKPLGLQRTTAAINPDLSNIAEAHLYHQSRPRLTHKPQVGDGSIMVGAMGIKSTMNDLLTYFKSLMSSFNDQQARNCTETPDSPFVQAQKLFSPGIVVKNENDKPKAEFAPGWMRTTLPGPMSEMGINEFFVKQFPVIGKGMKEPPTVYYHAGSTVGFLTSVTLIPETSSAVVVMSNTLGNQDLPDWTGLLILEELLNVPDRVDFLPYAQEAAATWSQQWPEMHATLDKDRESDGQIDDPSIYVGLYFNEVGTWFFDIFIQDGSLYMAYCGDRDSKYSLTQYRDSTLSFEITYEQSVARGLWPVPSADFYLLQFQDVHDDGRMGSIRWKYDWQEPGGENFRRNDDSRNSRVGQQVLANLA